MTPRVRLPAGEGLDFYLYFDDHNPPHVHVMTPEGEAAIALGSETQAPYVLVSSGLKGKDKNGALRLVQAHQKRLLDTWREHNA